ncbi:MAG TPA: hypothetical protein VFV38_51290 [Ktedonobacteraceae bacterium]|nr:hypothetical protein [Ktedonobacteraceae bacterium]
MSEPTHHSESQSWMQWLPYEGDQWEREMVPRLPPNWRSKPMPWEQ